MSRDREKPPFWRRNSPAPGYDIEKLRPSSLPKRERFETVRDAANESLRSQVALGQILPSTKLRECAAGDYQCDETYCPHCARTFRRWFSGELIRLVANRRAHIMTVLLEFADRLEIDRLDQACVADRLRKRLMRCGLRHTVVIGGFEIAYKAKRKRWILHVNLVILNDDMAAISRFETTMRGCKIDRAVQTVSVKDPAKQLSYVLKFSTYHRPYKKSGPRKSTAVPLNRTEHLALVNWMGKRSFSDFVFLFNARRRGARIVPAPPASC